MLIDELFETGGFWRGVGQSLAQRHTPGSNFSKTSYDSGQKLRQLAKKAGQAVTTTAATTGTTKPAQSPTPSLPPARDYSQYQMPTVFRQGVRSTSVPQPAVQQPQPAATKPRVPTQPIRVGNKIYRPGDPMHARLWQMMQAQQRT